MFDAIETFSVTFNFKFENEAIILHDPNRALSYEYLFFIAYYGEVNIHLKLQRN